MLDGSLKKRIIAADHRYSFNTKTGRDIYEKGLLREKYEKELRIYEALWNCRFSEPVPGFEPVNQARTLYVSNNTPVIMNRSYFDSLKNDANDTYPKPVFYPYNGTYYRSAAERSIAVFYTEMGIPFKYEPEVMLSGLRKPVYPDFVPYFKEIDSCKFHEHFGMMNASDYVRESKIKFNNFTNAGLLQDIDFLFTYNTEDTAYDIRFLSAKINTLILGSMVCCIDSSYSK